MMYVWCPVACPMCVLGDMSGVCRLQHPNLLCLQKHHGWHVSGLPMILLRKFGGKPIHHKQPQLWDYQMELSATPCHSHSLKYLEESNVTTCHNCSSLLAAPVRLKGPMRHRHLVVVDPLLRCQWDLRCEVPHSQQET